MPSISLSMPGYLIRLLLAVDYQPRRLEHCQALVARLRVVYVFRQLSHDKAMLCPLAAPDGIDLTVRAGERWAVLGASGAGKTTLFHVITDEFPPKVGTVRFFGEDVTCLPPVSAHSQGPAPHQSKFAAVQRPHGLRAICCSPIAV